MTRIEYVLPKSNEYGLVLGIAADGDHVVAVGGQGRDLFLHSTDGGVTFEPKRSDGRGLRSAWIEGDKIWVCGEYGYAAYSPDRGDSWHEIPTATRGCLFGIERDKSGNLWISGDGGFLVGISSDGEYWYPTLTQSGFSRMSTHPEGVMLPSDDPGHVFLLTPDGIRKFGLNAGGNLMKVRALDSGTILAVGAEGKVFRSTDNGWSFTASKTPTNALLCSVEAMPDGTVWAGGAQGCLLRSDDDGQTFETVEQGLEDGYLWCIERVHDALYVGGHRGVVFRIGEPRADETHMLPIGDIDISAPEFKTKSRPSIGKRSRVHRSSQHEGYIFDGDFETDINSILEDQERQACPTAKNSLTGVYTRLSTEIAEDLEKLLRLYRFKKVPQLCGLTPLIGSTIADDRNPHEIPEIFADAEPDEKQKWTQILWESANLFEDADGMRLIITPDGVHEFREDEGSIRYVCYDLATLFYLLVRGTAVGLGRYDADTLRDELDDQFDDWLGCEFWDEILD